LNNYSNIDPLAIVSRIAVGISTLTAYPIVFHGVRDGVLDVLEQTQTPEKADKLTYTLLALLTFISIFISDLGLINAIGGGLVTTPIVFVFPTMMYKAAASLKLGGGFEHRWEIGFASGLTLIGIFIGVVGAWIAVQTTLSS
jgi:sodium-coupled neutral amino acid transporter 11